MWLVALDAFCLGVVLSALMARKTIGMLEKENIELHERDMAQRDLNETILARSGQVLCVRCGSTGPDGWCVWCVWCGEDCLREWAAKQSAKGSSAPGGQP